MHGQRARNWRLAIAVTGMVVAQTASLGWAQSSELKIATIDVGKTFDGYQRTVDFDKQLGAKGSKKEDEHTRLVDEIKKLREGQELLSDKAKEERQKQLEEKVRKLQEFERVAREELQRERDTMAQQILQEIDQALQEYAKNQSYDLILNERVVVYGGSAFDITDKFLQWLNQRYKPKP